MIKSLTSLRFFFAFFVFISHCRFLKTESIYKNIFEEGHIGVSFFFILSGFILSRTYKEKFHNKKISLKTFYIYRIARIYPLHILTLLLAIPLGFVFSLSSYTILGLNTLLLQSYIPNRIFFYSFNIPSWSISDEMFFYLLFPLLITLSNKHLSRLFFTLLTAYIALYFAISSNSLQWVSNMGAMTAKMYTWATEDKMHWLFYISPFTRILDFILGILLYSLYTKRFLGASRYLEIWALSLFILVFSFHLSVFEIFRYSVYYWIPVSLIVYSFALEKGPVSRLLSSPIFVYLGEISFGFYLFHQIATRYTVMAINTCYPQLNIYILSLLCFLLTLVLSMLSYKYVEMPIVKKVRDQVK